MVKIWIDHVHFDVAWQNNMQICDSLAYFLVFDTCKEKQLQQQKFKLM